MLKFIVDGKELTEEEIKDECKKVDLDLNEKSSDKSSYTEDVNKFINILD